MKKLALFICILPLLLYSQTQKYESKVQFAIETYAFLKGQSAALQMVVLQFPTLKADIAAAEENSKVLFRRAERNIEHFLDNEMDNSEFDILQNRIDSMLNEQLRKPIEKKKYALDFLSKIKDRPHLISDSLLLKGILSFAYHDAPHQEITDGHAKMFSTKGHPKADETTLKLPIPKSWRAEEAEMPETIQQFTSYCGNGNEKIVIVAYDLTAEKQDLILDEKSVSEMIPPQTKLIRTDAVIIDDQPGIMVEVEEILHLSNDKMKIRMLQFMVAQKRKLYCVQGSIGPVAIHENLEPQIKKYEPLFRLIAAKTQID